MATAICTAGFALGDAVFEAANVVALLRDVSGVLALAAAVCITGFAVVDAMPFDAAALPREASAEVAPPATVCVAGFDDVEPFSGFEFAAVCVAGDATVPGAL